MKAFGFTLISSLILVLASCDSRLDIIPKGETTLSNLDDLELLLNQEYSLHQSASSDLGVICNESVPEFLTVPEVLASRNTLNCAYLAYDESIDRAVLCQSSDRYSQAYKYINYMNTILAKIDGVDGEPARKSEIKAKARIMRAWFHFLLVNIHAAQYDPAILAEAGGIPYVTDIDATAVKPQLSLADTYAAILDDCSDAVIEALPVENTNVSQADRAFGYAVRAKVLLQTKDYAAAIPLFRKALEINGRIEDRAYIKETGEWTLPQNSPNHYVWIGYGPKAAPFCEMLSLETAAKFEKKDFVHKYAESGWNYGFGNMYSGIEGIPMFFGMSACINPYGLSSDALHYDLAECLVRTGAIRDGLALADKVRKCRVEAPTPLATLFDMMPLKEKQAMDLLEPIKWIENIGTCWNFFDTKRRNSEPAYARSITRNLKGYGTFTITPGSPLWILPFPAVALRYNPTLTQNYSTTR